MCHMPRHATPFLFVFRALYDYVPLTADHMLVVPYIMQGHVYVKFMDATIAIKCHAKMHDRVFGEFKIVAEFMSETDYSQKFPVSANATAALTV